MSRTLPFLRTLALAVIGFQQFDNVCLNPGGIIAFGEILFQFHSTKTNLVLLVGLGFPENVEDLIHGQLPDHGSHNHDSEESVCPPAFFFTVFITLDFSPPKTRGDGAK